MAKIVLIPCVSKKRQERSKAKDLYTSPLFTYALRYAESLRPDKIYVLSAKYGLLDLMREVDPYELTLNKMSTAQVKVWAGSVLRQLASQADLQQDTFIFLAGDRYRKFLMPAIAHIQVPLKGLGIGRQLQFLKSKTADRAKPHGRVRA